MPLTLEGFPQPLEWAQEPASWELEPYGLVVTAGPKTDLITDPQGGAPVSNAPHLMFKPEGDFVFKAKVTVSFKSKFDAGVLLIYQNEQSWAKLCFEFAPQGYPIVVSVVNKGTSDDCNSLFIDENNTYLRISRLGNAYAFHHSVDGEYWYLVRIFALEPGLETKVGFLVQSPTGEACTAIFSKLSFESRTLEDIRSGE